MDLHVLFEAAGNEPEERLRVLDVIEELVRTGMLDACGGDFYALTTERQSRRRSVLNGAPPSAVCRCLCRKSSHPCGLQ